ncbi:hypothetical protein HC766_09370 [Candidatus Gracilibacteria bacterium]|nr:hypothetical protein [Candidatus Gracilibacteria bacterium]
MPVAEVAAIIAQSQQEQADQNRSISSCRVRHCETFEVQRRSNKWKIRCQIFHSFRIFTL